MIKEEEEEEEEEEDDVVSLTRVFSRHVDRQLSTQKEKRFLSDIQNTARLR